MSTSPSKSTTFTSVVEAKPLGVELEGPARQQAIDYGANQGIEWAILTSPGAVWRTYKIESRNRSFHVLVAEIESGWR